ncbi:hypothetical protein BSG1_20059 [Bacillus sp. SG-1]|nr:hypothetical protein BSG1_20059 [Bacillus sp. SG-1]
MIIAGRDPAVKPYISYLPPKTTSPSTFFEELALAGERGHGFGHFKTSPVSPLISF